MRRESFHGLINGNLLVPDDDGVADILKFIRRRAAFHSEDEFRLRERRALAETGKVETHPVLARCGSGYQQHAAARETCARSGKNIHVLHISTEEEMQILAANRDIASVEVTPQHLTLARRRLMKNWHIRPDEPPIREGRHRAALWKALEQGIVDVIGSDHARIRAKKRPMPIRIRRRHAGRADASAADVEPYGRRQAVAGKLVFLTSYRARSLFNLADKGEVALGNHAI